MNELSKFIGQEKIKSSLITLISAAQKKEAPLQHLLFCGQPGMGKVTLAKLIAIQMGKKIKIVSGKTIRKIQDIVELLFTMEESGVLIIEQIDSIRDQVLESIIVSITDFSIDIPTGIGKETIKIMLPHFTLIGTTSKPSHIDERFSSLMFEFKFLPYDMLEISNIISVSSKQQNIEIASEAANLIAEYSRGCPSEALLLLNKVHKYSIANADEKISPEITQNAFEIFGIDNNSPKFERQTISDDIKMFVWQRDKGKCSNCGSQENLEFDHIIPVSKGGSNIARNIQILCEKCNRIKGAKIF